CEVLADHAHAGGRRLEGELRVEAGDSVHVGRRDVETSTDLVDAAVAEPTDGVGDRMQRWQHEMTLTSSVGSEPSVGIEGVELELVGFCVAEVQVHQTVDTSEPIRSMRMALA